MQKRNANTLLRRRFHQLIDVRQRKVAEPVSRQLRQCTREAEVTEAGAVSSSDILPARVTQVKAGSSSAHVKERNYEREKNNGGRHYLQDTQAAPDNVLVIQVQVGTGRTAVAVATLRHRPRRVTLRGHRHGSYRYSGYRH